MRWPLLDLFIFGFGAAGICFPHLARRRWWVYGAAVLCAVLAAKFVRILLHNWADPAVLDFYCFWVYGQAISHSLNPYDPAVLRPIAAALPVSAEFSHSVAKWFTAENVDAGMTYPPTSIALFYPLGLFRGMHAASAAWSLMNVLAICCAALCVWRSYLRKMQSAGLLAAFLLMAFPPILITLQIEQTTILLLLFVVAFAQERAAWRAGVWIALAVVAKPVAVFLLMLPALRRSYAALAAAGVTAAGFCAAAVAIVGPRAFGSYFTDNPVARVPGSLYREPAYQSIWSVLLRASHDTSAHYGFAHHGFILATALAIVAATAALCVRIPRRDSGVALALVVSMALIVYPGTLYFYNIVLLVPMLVLWSIRERLPKGGAFVLAVFMTEAVLSTYQSGMALAYLGPLLTWLVFAGIAIGPALRSAQTAPVTA